jgi:hypothetical protein
MKSPLIPNINPQRILPKLTWLRGGGPFAMYGLYKGAVEFVKVLEKLGVKVPSTLEFETPKTKPNHFHKLGFLSSGIVAAIGFVFRNKVPKQISLFTATKQKEKNFLQNSWELAYNNPFWVIGILIVIVFHKTIARLLLDSGVREQTLRDITRSFRSQQDFIQRFSQESYNQLIRTANMWSNKFYNTLEQIRVKDIADLAKKDLTISELRTKIEDLSEKLYQMKAAMSQNNFVIKDCQATYTSTLKEVEDNQVKYMTILKEIYNAFLEVRGQQVIAPENEKMTHLANLLTAIQYLPHVQPNNVQNFIEKMQPGSLDVNPVDSVSFLGSLHNIYKYGQNKAHKYVSTVTDSFE